MTTQKEQEIVVSLGKTDGSETTSTNQKTLTTVVQMDGSLKTLEGVTIATDADVVEATTPLTQGIEK